MTRLVMGEEPSVEVVGPTCAARWAKPGVDTLRDLVAWCGIGEPDTPVRVKWRKRGGKYDEWEDTCGGLAVRARLLLAQKKTLLVQREKKKKFRETYLKR